MGCVAKCGVRVSVLGTVGGGERECLRGVLHPCQMVGTNLLRAALLAWWVLPLRCLRALHAGAHRDCGRLRRVVEVTKT